MAGATMAVRTAKGLPAPVAYGMAGPFFGLLYPFEDDSNPLANADAHSAQGIPAAGAQKLIKGGGNEARAAGAQRMADGDGAAIGIDVRGVIGNAQVAEHGQ